MRSELPSGTVTFLFTDVEGSTKLLHELGAEAYDEALITHRSALREAFQRHGGVEVDTQGDAFFYAFPTAPGAVDAARDGIEALSSGPIFVRVGLHTGTPHIGQEGYIGDDVHLGARIAATAHGGQVVLSRETRVLVDGDITDLGEHRLKDISQAVPIFQVGDGSFPPLKTISNTNLPRPASSFVGRDDELLEVLTRFEGGARLVTLTGPGGTGKTRLAVEAAASLVPEYKAGVFWVGLATLRDPALVTETIAQTLGAKEGLAEHIGEREVLLLLDNLEQVIDCAPGLSELLSVCPNLTLLCTSRELLRVTGEVEYAVPPLTEQEAVDLFCERAQLGPNDDIAELCERLDSLPLAVELAAARTSALTPEQILERLSQRLDLLKGGRDADPRQQTLRTTIEWSYELLSPEEQELFARLSVFAGGCTLEAAEEVADADLDALQSIVEKSLARFTDGRYWMLETIREYAAARHADTEAAGEIRRRHAVWFAELMEAAEPELESVHQEQWLARVVRELDNIRVATRCALDRGDADLALRLTGPSALFWWIHGLWSEGRRWLEASLFVGGDQNPALRAKALEGAAHLAVRQFDVARAKTLADEGLAIRRDLGDARGIARSLRIVGLVATVEGDNERFREAIEQSAAYAHEADDLWTLSMALNNLGYLAQVEEEFERATQLFEEALQIARERGDQRSEAMFLQNLGLTKLGRGVIEEAHGDFVASLRVAHRLGYQEMVAHDLLGIAAIVTTSGNPELAARLVGGYRELAEATGPGLDPVTARVERQVIESIEGHLGPEKAAAVVGSGRNAPLDDLVEQALHSVD